jgi:hypothetical protein
MRRSPGPCTIACSIDRLRVEKQLTILAPHVTVITVYRRQSP